MTGRLHNKIALITGSDSGIGQGSAIEFAKEGRRSIVVQADISDEDQVFQMFAEAIETFGRIDILMNNAGVDASGDEVHELATETWDAAMKTNLYGAFCDRKTAGLRWGRKSARKTAGVYHP